MAAKRKTAKKPAKKAAGKVAKRTPKRKAAKRARRARRKHLGKRRVKRNQLEARAKRRRNQPLPRLAAPALQDPRKSSLRRTFPRCWEESPLRRSVSTTREKRNRARFSSIGNAEQADEPKVVRLFGFLWLIVARRASRAARCESRIPTSSSRCSRG